MISDGIRVEMCQNKQELSVKFSPGLFQFERSLLCCRVTGASATVEEEEKENTIKKWRRQGCDD